MYDQTEPAQTQQTDGRGEYRDRSGIPHKGQIALFFRRLNLKDPPTSVRWY